MNAPNSELKVVREQPGKGVYKAHKACVPCRRRKVKCDADAIGVPCSRCTLKQTVEHCALLNRKIPAIRSKFQSMQILPSQGHMGILAVTPTNSSASNDLTPSRPSSRSTQSVHSPQPVPAEALDSKLPRQTKSPLTVRNILNEDVEATVEPSRQPVTFNTPHPPRARHGFIPRNFRWRTLPKLDDVDNEYLLKKGVFDLPPLHHMDTLVKIYFDHIHPFVPIINRHDFIRRYQSGDCSLFLLRVILTTAAVHAPANVLSSCGFASCSAAQESFFARAKLLHDFTAEDDLFLVLQGAIILCTVILDRPSNRDFGFWFHAAIGLAAKLDVQRTCAQEKKPRHVLKIHRRIWWALYSLDTFHVFANTSRSRLLEDTFNIKPRTEEDWDEEDGSEVLSGLVSPITPQQKASPGALCELSRIVSDCLFTVKSRPEQDPRQIMCQLDVWRQSLAPKMHIGGSSEDNIYYINLRALSYRFECILCRLMGWLSRRSDGSEKTEWVKQRLRLSMLELDTITMRVFASGSLPKLPSTFITTIITLLALHIETAVDPVEEQMPRSRARISISQLMLVLTECREIPIVRRALPIFEDILSKYKLDMFSPSFHGPISTHPHTRSSEMAPSAHGPLQNAASVALSRGVQSGINWQLYGDFIGLDFMDDWISEA